jgi:hypothetical protein
MFIVLTLLEVEDGIQTNIRKHVFSLPETSGEWDRDIKSKLITQ